MNQQVPVHNADGWVNISLNLGNKGGDPVAGSRYGRVSVLDRVTLEDLYRSDGMGRRVVDVPVDEALRGWIEGEQELLNELKRLSAKNHVVEALKWARLFGGAVIVALIDDSLDFADPVNENGVRRVLQLRVYDRHRVSWTNADIDQDPMSPYFGLPTHYTISPPQGTSYRVHVSRMYRIDGLDLPDNARQRNNGWGDSALQSVYQALMNYGLTMNATVSIVRDFVQTVLGINGLSEMIAAGQDDLVAKRAQAIDMTRSVANTIFLDAEGETYQKQASSVTGLPDLWDRFALHVSACTGIPATKLMGRAPQGMDATGEGDERNWYDVVEAYRTDEVEPLMEWLSGLLDSQLEWTERPETMDWTWPALGQPSEREWAEIRKLNAETDQIYVNAGAADAQYIYHLRFSQEDYRSEITYDPQAYEEWFEKYGPSEEELVAEAEREAAARAALEGEVDDEEAEEE